MCVWGEVKQKIIQQRQCESIKPTITKYATKMCVYNVLIGKLLIFLSPSTTIKKTLFFIIRSFHVPHDVYFFLFEEYEGLTSTHILGSCFDIFISLIYSSSDKGFDQKHYIKNKICLSRAMSFYI